MPSCIHAAASERVVAEPPAFQDAAVAQAFEAIGAFSPAGRETLLVLRALIFEVAAVTPGVGALRETLKWGEPSYRSERPRTGSAVRLGCKAALPGQVAMYFHCQTTLVPSFRTRFGHGLRFEGRRALLLDAGAALPRDALAFCVAAALSYRRGH